MCGMIAIRIISGANLIPVRGPHAVMNPRAHAACRHVRAYRPIGLHHPEMHTLGLDWRAAPVPFKMTREQGSDGGTRTTPMLRALGDVTS